MSQATFGVRVSLPAMNLIGIKTKTIIEAFGFGRSRAHDAKSVVSKATKAMGAENLKTLQWTGSGSSYDAQGQHGVIKSYSQQMDMNGATATARIDGMPVQGDTQLEYWLTPYGFLRAAMSNPATFESKSVYG